MEATQSPGYRGFGSFHSDNVEDLIRAPAMEYSPPAYRVDSNLWDPAASPPPFGAALKAADFFLDPGWTFVNHGAFGATCRVAMEASGAWRLYAEQQPLRFIDRELFPLLVHSLREAAIVLNASPTSVALLPNATYGLNVAVRAARLQPGASVFALDIGYGSVKKLLADAVAIAGATLTTHTVVFPVTGRDDLVSQIVSAMPHHIDLAVFDHVSSNSGIVLPVDTLIRAAHERGARVIIDGAHGMQSQTLDFKASGADWYITNAHKWACSVKGLALMAVSDRALPTTTPLVISHGAGAGFTSSFIWDGTRDTAPAVALPTLLRWWAWVGTARARAYCEALLRDAVTLLMDAWGTRTHAPLSLYSHMACVELPVASLPAGAALRVAASAATANDGKLVQDALHFNHKVECPVKALGGKLYVRISAAVYNELADYAALAAAVLALQWAEADSS